MSQTIRERRMPIMAFRLTAIQAPLTHRLGGYVRGLPRLLDHAS
jgi:hypothetical protein